MDRLVPALVALVVKGLANGNFNPTSTATRAEMTAFICRAIPSAMTSGPCVGNTWACEDWSSDPNTNFPDLYLAPPELQMTIRTLKHYGVAYGYQNGYFGTNDPVNKSQVIAFITRALVYKGYWYHLAGWDPGVYANVTVLRQEVLTYYRYVGPIYGTESNIWNWPDWTGSAQRQWFVEAEWRAFVKAGI